MPSPRYAPPKFHQIPVGRSPVKKWITESVDYTAPHSACSESVSRRGRASGSSPHTCRPNFMTIGSLEPEICRFKVDILVNGVSGHNGILDCIPMKHRCLDNVSVDGNAFREDLSLPCAGIPAPPTWTVAQCDAAPQGLRCHICLELWHVQCRTEPQECLFKA